jgi:L-methionine (R)-S-oxide reductase
LQDLRSLVNPIPLQEFSSKPELYDFLTRQLHTLLEGESDFLANAANAASLVYHSLPEVNWAGFYFFRNGQLVVGPFQGKPACTRLALGRGVCGTAAAERRTVVVPNVHDFPGHVACDSASASEIVVPIIAEDRLIGVFDVDSPAIGRFDAEDRVGLESVVRVFIEANGEKLRAESLFCD